MISRQLALLPVVVLALGVPYVRAQKEPLDGHTEHAPKTIVLDNEHIFPSDLEMSTKDAVVFENHSIQPITVTFTEPADLPQKIRCGLIRKSENDKARAPWQLFVWSDHKLRATIPPGRFASICSLQEGSYTYLVSLVSTGVGPQEGGGLPEKGQISVK